MGVLYALGRLDMSFSNGALLVLVAAVVYFVSYYEEGERNKAPHATSPTIWASVDPITMLKVKNYRALPMGSYRSDLLGAHTGGQGTLIWRAPHNGGKLKADVGGKEVDFDESDMAYFDSGGNLHLFAAPVPIKEGSIDPELLAVMRDRKGFSPPYYYADRPLFPKGVRTAIGVKSPSEEGESGVPLDLDDLLKENKSLKNEANAYRDLYEGRNKEVDKLVARIRGAARGDVKSALKEFLEHQGEHKQPPSSE
jgi:hypothetical protein